MKNEELNEMIRAAVEKAVASVMDELKKEEQKNPPVETPDDEKREALAAKETKTKSEKLITVGYKYIGDGCDARVIMPVNTSDLHVATNTAYALIYAAADVLSGHMDCDKSAMANAMMMAMTDHLIQDTISMMFGAEV